MDFHSALRQTMAKHHLRIEHVAIAGNVSYSAIRKYLNGGKPGYDATMALRAAYPDFADLIDGKAAA